MGTTQKIATCCYCGMRAALVLSGVGRHQLSCVSCGAPLHTLKMLRSDAAGERELVRPSAIRTPDTAPRHHRSARPRKGSRGKSLSQRFMEKMRDAAEEVLDEVFDIFD